MDRGAGPGDARRRESLRRTPSDGLALPSLRGVTCGGYSAGAALPSLCGGGPAISARGRLGYDSDMTRIWIAWAAPRAARPPVSRPPSSPACCRLLTTSQSRLVRDVASRIPDLSSRTRLLTTSQSRPSDGRYAARGVTRDMPPRGRAGFTRNGCGDPPFRLVAKGWLRQFYRFTGPLAAATRVWRGGAGCAGWLRCASVTDPRVDLAADCRGVPGSAPLPSHVTHEVT